MGITANTVVTTVAGTPTFSILIPVCDIRSAPCNNPAPTTFASGDSIQPVNESNFMSSDLIAASDFSTSSSTPAPNYINSNKPTSGRTLGIAVGIFFAMCSIFIAGLCLFLARRRRMTRKNDEEIVAKFTPYPFALDETGKVSSTDPSKLPEKELDEKDIYSKETTAKGVDEEEIKRKVLLSSLPTLAKHNYFTSAE